MCFLVCSISDCPENAFRVKLQSPHSGRVIHRMVINYLGSGLFLVQYKMFGDFEDVSLTITHDNRHVSGSPYYLGVLFHNDCACPLVSAEAWLSRHECPEVEEAQIAEDLEPFRSAEEGVNITELYQRASVAYSRNSFVHYSVVKGKVSAEWK